MKNYDFVRIDFLSVYKGFGVYNFDLIDVTHPKCTGALLSVMWDSKQKHLYVCVLWYLQFNFGNVPDDVKYLEERAARGDRTKFEEVLSKIRSVEPDEEDRWDSVLEINLTEDEENWYCCDCGSKMQCVRPGKWQCTGCDGSEGNVQYCWNCGHPLNDSKMCENSKCEY